MKPELGIRYQKTKVVLFTNLIVHNCIPNIFHQTCKFIRILFVGEKSLNVPLLFQWFKFLQDFLQLPSITCQLDLSQFWRLLAHS